MTKKTLIIAEAGVNHNGDFDKAIQLIDAAAEAGADYVKFQTFVTEHNVSRKAQKASYQVQNTNEEGTQYDMLKKLEIPESWYDPMMKRCEELNIGFLSTGFDKPSIDFLDELGCSFFKIPSGELTNKMNLEYFASKGKPIVISTGMGTMDDIRNALAILKNNGISHSDITVLHCNTQYPTPMKDVNLKAMLDIQEQLNVNVGYSDHTLGIEIPIAAVALGATVIEKHFTLDKTLPGPDHLASLDPDELKAMVQGIRNVELALSGDGKKSISESESTNLIIARKSVHLSKKLSSGHVLTKDDFIMLRPGDGISPMDYDSLIGKTLNRDIEQYEQLQTVDLS